MLVIERHVLTIRLRKSEVRLNERYVVKAATNVVLMALRHHFFLPLQVLMATFTFCAVHMLTASTCFVSWYYAEANAGIHLLFTIQDKKQDLHYVGPFRGKK